MEIGASRWLDVTLVRQPGWCSVVMCGELDLGSAELLAATCAEVTDPTVLIDFAGLTFIDCAGYRALVDVLRGIRSHGARVLLVGMHDEVGRFLTLVGHGQPPASMYGFCPDKPARRWNA